MSTVNAPILSELMTSKGWTKVAFARECGISISYLSDILSGRSRLERSPDLMLKMARVLNIPVSFIERSVETGAAAS